MEELFSLKVGSVDSFMDVIKSEPRGSVLNALKVAIDQAPSTAPTTAAIITKLIQSDPSYKEDVVAILKDLNTDDVGILGRIAYLTLLGGAPSAAPFAIQPISDVLSDVAISLEVPAIFAKRQVLPESQNNALDVFYCYSIIRNISFYKLECCYRLRSFQHAAVIEAILMDETLPAIGIAIEMCKMPGFIQSLCQCIGLFSQRSRLVGLIFIAYYKTRAVRPTGQYVCMQNDDDKESLRTMFDDETVQFCLRAGNKYRLNAFLGTNYTDPNLPFLSAREFEYAVCSTKVEFFEAFLKVSSPSVTHFLSYLEEHKDRFRLSDDEQQLFIKMLKEFHSDNVGYLDIVIPKLAKFGIIKEPFAQC